MYQANINLDPNQVVDLFAVAVGNTPSADLTGAHVIVVQNNGSQPIYLGSASVYAGAGYKLASGREKELRLTREHLYAAATSSAASDIAVLVVIE